jgi:hypothetical protein
MAFIERGDSEKRGSENSQRLPSSSSETRICATGTMNAGSVSEASVSPGAVMAICV